MRISNELYQKRRASLMAKLPEKSIVVLYTGRLRTRNNDCDYEFRPQSDFYYLTGFPEPDAYAVISGQGQVHLFSLPKDPEKELWDGFRYGIEGAKAEFAIDVVSPISDFMDTLVSLCDGMTRIAFAFADTDVRSHVFDVCDRLSQQVRRGAIAPTQLCNVTPLIAEMRLIKDEQEIAIMHAAAQISVAAHQRAMQCVQPGWYEYQLEAELNYVFMQSGARQPAYNNIVATGKNACTLHYIRNDARIEQDDLVLIDAGCELGCYAADITRTFPANGRFSPAQAALYQIVLDAYYAGLQQLQVGAPYDACHNAAVEVICAGLLRLGLLQGELASVIENKTYRDFYMHNTGHWLGLDVHDAGAYKLDGVSRPLQAGMVVTLEPGIYVAADNLQVESQWRGIGIRIEDDVLITEQGPRVLTHGLPIEIAAIEALMAVKQ